MDEMEHSTTSVLGTQSEKARERLDKMVLSALLISLGVTGSLLPFATFLIGASRCAPLQHLINVLGAVLLGPGFAVINAFLISLLRNMLGTGTLLAFPGSMIGALLAGFLYQWFKKDGLAVLGEFVGTGLVGGLAAYPFARWLMGNTPAAVVWNLGTFHSEMENGIRASLAAVSRRAIPVVIDPVAAQAYPGPRDFMMEILKTFENIYAEDQLACRIIIRCNTGELACLCETKKESLPQNGSLIQSGGVDNLIFPDDSEGIFRTFLHIFEERLPLCVVMTGETDYIGWTDPKDTIPCDSQFQPLYNPDIKPGKSRHTLLTVTDSCRLLTSMTGAGCMSNTLIAAFCSAAVTESELSQGRELSPWREGEQSARAARAALVFLIESAQKAEAVSRGMGSFQVNLMDELSRSMVE